MYSNSKEPVPQVGSYMFLGLSMYELAILLNRVLRVLGVKYTPPSLPEVLA